MTNKERFITLLRTEILKVDLAELDFGIYRILNHRRDAIDEFLDDELPAVIDRALASPSKDSSGDKSAEESTDAERDRLYNHLYTFFSRYYRNGDFEPQPRRARDARYSVPYNGQDIHFHWRSSGSYYIKTSEQLLSYSFVTPPWRVRFELVSAYQEPDNVKGDARYFIPVPGHSSANSTGSRSLFTLPFDFRRLTDEEHSDFASKNSDADGDTIQERVIVGSLSEVDLPVGLSRADVLKHAIRYARKNRSDYYVHPRLGEFLTRELQHYVNREFVHVSTNAEPQAIVAQLPKLQAFSKIAGRIIALLDELESFQARLFEKRRFVLDTDYLVALRMVPEELRSEVLENDEQRATWERDFGIADELDEDALSEFPSLVVDTALFDPSFKVRLLSSIDDIDAVTDGVIVRGENFGALRTLLPSFERRAKLVYIDPPYNTGGDGFLYRDDFSRHSAWLSLMDCRLRLGRELLALDGAFAVSIDDNEQVNLVQLANRIFGSENFLTSMVWEGGLKNDSRYISVGHDYIVTYLRDAQHLAETGERWRTRKEGIDDIYEVVGELTEKHSGDYSKASRDLRKWYKQVGKSHPAYAHRHYRWVDKEGVYFAGDIAWPGPGGPTYSVSHPLTGEPVKTPANGWRYTTPERMQEMIDAGRIHFDKDHTTVPKVKRYLHELEGEVMPSVFYRDRRAAVKSLRALMGENVFDNPKDTPTLEKLIEASTNEDSWVVDYFAGSGTTGHAVISLNRELNSSRRFLLVEMGEYFDDVLKRRLSKVMFAKSWNEGRPRTVPRITSTPVPEWIEHSPRMVQVLNIETYEDSLNSLETSEAPELTDDLDLAYGLEEGSRQQAPLLNTEQFERPFEYDLKVHTEEGVRRQRVDLVSTWNLFKGIRPSRYRQFEHGSRKYVVVEGLKDGAPVLTIWRSVVNLDADAERDFLNDKIRRELDMELAQYRCVWHNADSVLPNGRSLDKEFKRIMFQAEPVLA